MTEPMKSYADPVDLDAIEKRLSEAVPGPWASAQQGVGDWVVTTGSHKAGTWDYMGGCPDCGVRPSFDEADAEFIAHAPADIARLVSALREAQAKVERVEALAADFDGGQYNIICRLIRAALADPEEGQ